MKLKCAMIENCPEPCTHIDNKGFVYCLGHGQARKLSHPCRKLTNKERSSLENGIPIAYKPSK